MPEVDIYDVKGAMFDEREFSLTELPPISQEITDILTDIGGTCNNFPNVRIVSGLDPAQQEWVGGRWWLKYAFRDHTVKEYAILHKPDGTKKVLTKKEGEVMSTSNKLKGIVIPVTERNVIEYGIPRYFVELYKPAEGFGSPVAWEAIRWNEDEDGKMVDLMGEFPLEGRYETWFCLEEAVVEDGVVVKTKFRAIDDLVIEFIKYKVEELKSKTPAQKHDELRKEVDAEYIEHKKQLKEDIRDIVKEHENRLYE